MEIRSCLSKIFCCWAPSGCCKKKETVIEAKVVNISTRTLPTTPPSTPDTTLKQHVWGVPDMKEEKDKS